MCSNEGWFVQLRLFLAVLGLCSGMWALLGSAKVLPWLQHRLELRCVGSLVAASRLSCPVVCGGLSSLARD